MEASKQDLYYKFMNQMKIQSIILLKHTFNVEGPMAQGVNTNLNVDSKLLSNGFVENALIAVNRYELKALQENKTVWVGEYIYQVELHTDREIYDEVMQDEELKKMFEMNQIMIFLWPYVRQEVQSDTQKAGILQVVLPPRL